MNNLNYLKKNLFIISTGILLLVFINSCGLYKPVDSRKISPNSKCASPFIGSRLIHILNDSIACFFLFMDLYDWPIK